MNYCKEAQYDEQGLYMHSLMKDAGWDEKGLQGFLVKNFRKSHWNLINESERRRVISMLRKYAAKNRAAQQAAKGKKLRKNIMGLWTANGFTYSDMHDAMKIWGYGESLRALTLKELYEVFDYVRLFCSAKKETK
ncbi:MAG TPA: hypothetical protein PKZ69_07125 [Candidatus Cloacimonadota bacterium]|nr:hypothetical protein [Candidatus Cloacimonadota bacterium]HPK41380.1 hypothetical protein [Candidatus Cloacimonadota bacterium]